MNEDFLAIIKLISGEEILSTVSYLDDENLLILDCPVVMKCDGVRQHGVNVVRVEPWIKTGVETLYMIPMENIITLSEVIDSKTIRIYSKFVKVYYYDYDYESIDEKITKEMGYISTVKEARSTLEKLYRNS